jgi:hypothetical protein
MPPGEVEQRAVAFLAGREQGVEALYFPVRLGGVVVGPQALRGKRRLRLVARRFAEALAQQVDLGLQCAHVHGPERGQGAGARMVGEHGRFLRHSP